MRTKEEIMQTMKKSCYTIYELTELNVEIFTDIRDELVKLNEKRK